MFFCVDNEADREQENGEHENADVDEDAEIVDDDDDDDDDDNDDSSASIISSISSDQNDDDDDDDDDDDIDNMYFELSDVSNL